MVMKIFGDYARYYNLLYADKPYEDECRFILKVLARHACQPASVLDLGCGTGSHLHVLAAQGISAQGVDMSETMLALAEARRSEKAANPAFSLGDVRSVRLGRVFDAVTSLFHVMSYQRSEEDALALMRTAHGHLTPGGLFFFDFWHGPGVLADPPAIRQKKLENDEIIVERHSRPEHRSSDKEVDVHFDIRLTDKKNGQTSLLHETHAMRYWFAPELRRLAEETGFRLAAEGGWMRMDGPSADDWYAWMLLER